ncbi:hypothetical protein [Candidatus Thiodiazotropha sp. CDECU1]|uniref:hypothetical protein n=1 Tax=Candidatus Thiodiazotropha sp. CDECU1 TaxID=3065865 RepID=UPI00292F81D5|nr:hypothetical protein [Candidatus Thiodiazotropha sp. CDECU1]
MENQLAIYASAIVLGIVSSLVASAIWLYFFARLRPNIEISPFISIGENETGKYYVIKLVNKTRRPIINIRCRLNLVQPKSIPGGLIYSNRGIKLEREEVFMIDKFDDRDEDAKYAWRFVCREDLETDWNEKQGAYLIFRVLATDSLSGLSKYFAMRFFTKSDCLLQGSHGYGKDVTVK